MRICVTVEGQEDITWADWLALARACEQGGFEGIFRSDHYDSVVGAGERGSLDAWATLSALAAVTERLRLGTIVTPVTFRHPSVLARMVTTVDHVSGGRAELGLGMGWFEGEHRAAGIPFPPTRERAERFAEALEIVHRQWTEDVFSFHGRHYVLEDCRALPKPVQSPRPPIIVGGSALPGTLVPAVRFADEYNTFASPAVSRERRALIDAACARSGRDPATLPLSVMCGLVIGETPAEVAARLDDSATRLRFGGAGELLEARGDGWLIGTPAEVVERINAYEAAGVSRIFMQVWGGDAVPMLGLVAAEVLPAL
jgi:F420-dependent oxidoreductase-like protein